MASTAKGTYIYLDRGILDNWIYNDKPFNRSMAWIDLLLLAEHTTHKAIWRGQMTEFKRGDVCLSITELAKRWGWSRDKTRRFISQLESDNMVRANCTTNRTTITIVKYDDFQNRRTTNKATDKATDKATNKSTDKTHLINNKELLRKEKEKVAPLQTLSDTSDEDDDENDLEKYPWNDPSWFDGEDEERK